MQVLKREICLILCVFSLLFCFTSCKNAVETRSEDFWYMGTVITVCLYEVDEKTASSVFEECDDLLYRLHTLWAKDSESGDVFRLTECGRLEDPDPRTVSLLQVAKSVSDATDGAFDVTVAPLVSLWESSEKAGRLPSDPELQSVLGKVGMKHLSISDDLLLLDGGGIDLGGIGKGAAAGALLSLLESKSLSGGYVSFGSNVATFGKKPDGSPFRTALRDPSDTEKSVGVLTLLPGDVLSVSGDYERFYTIGGEKYHHILDPVTGFPAEKGLHSVAVVARDGALADALSTALFVLGEDAAMDLYRSKIFTFEAVFMTTSGEIHVTDGLSSRFVPA